MKISLFDKTIKTLLPITIVGSLAPTFFSSCSSSKLTNLCLSVTKNKTNLFCYKTHDFDVSKIPTLYFSKDNNNWKKIDIQDESQASNPFITLDANEKVYLKGNNPSGFSYGEREFIHFSATDSNNDFTEFNASGDVMSLVDDGKHTTTIPNDYCFYSLFGETDYTECHLVTPPSLPATQLRDYCYSYMFFNDNSLISAPELPSTEVKNKCYAYMFSQCTSLKAAPILKATKSAPYCYDHMFYGNSSNEFIELHLTDWDRNGNFPCCFWVSFDGEYKMSPKGVFRCPKALIPNIDDPDNFSETKVPYNWTIQTF